MKIAVHSTADVQRLPKEVSELHLVRPIPGALLEKAFHAHPSISRVSLSASCLKRISARVRKLFRERGIALSVQSTRGRPIGIGMEQLLNVIELRKDFQPFRGIEQATGIPKSTVHYLVKYAARRKIRKGKDTVYLT